MATNKGGLRKNVIAPGELRVMDIFELLPFENALVALELTGEQVRQFLDVMMEGDEPAQSGARIRYRTLENRKGAIVSVAFSGPDGTEKQLDPAAVYTVVTIDYLMNRGGGYSDILKAGKNIRPLNVTMRDAVIAYVRERAAAGQAVRATLDGRYHSENPAPKEGEKSQ